MGMVEWELWNEVLALCLWVIPPTITYIKEEEYLTPHMPLVKTVGKLTLA